MTGPTSFGWQPTEIRRFIRNFDTGAGVILVLTDAGEEYQGQLNLPVEGEDDK